MADSVLEGRHWCPYKPPPARGTCSRVSGISPGSPHRPPPRIGAAALNATDDEKIGELVIALMGQEPGDEPRRPRTPLLAPFITHDVLLRVNNSLLRRQTTLSEGAGAAGRSWSCGGSPHGLAAGGVHGGCQARGETRCRPGPAALCTPSNPHPTPGPDPNQLHGGLERSFCCCSSLTAPGAWL